MPLTIWDQALGVSRELTQRDVDLMQAKINAYGKLLALSAQVQAEMFAEIGNIQQRYERSEQLSGDVSG